MMPAPVPEGLPEAVPGRNMQIRQALAVLTTLGLFSTIAFMLLYPIPTTGHDALLILVGALSGGWATVLGYYFTSSPGTDRFMGR